MMESNLVAGAQKLVPGKPLVYGWPGLRRPFGRGDEGAGQLGGSVGGIEQPQSQRSITAAHSFLQEIIVSQPDLCCITR
jgi:hypothetical protein